MGAQVQSVLAPAGDPAAAIAVLWWIMLAVTAAVFGGVLVVLLLGVRRSRSASPPVASERALFCGVAAASGATIVVLIGLLVASVMTGRAQQRLADRADLAIDVTGHQWWWDVQYVTRVPSATVRTANELHLPAGRTVTIALASADVIHSLWIPNLAGKMDLVPGRLNVLNLRAERPGVYRAQCAEFCGVQHAHMALTVVVESEPAFEAWLDAERQAPPAPDTAAARRGRDVVLGGSCVLCHAIGGTDADARNGPDLTHIATRPAIAAGTLPNTTVSLSAWLADPQRVKPGAKMPIPGLSDADRAAAVSYLETLR